MAKDKEKDSVETTDEVDEQEESNEVPVLLEKDEKVLSKDEVKDSDGGKDSKPVAKPKDDRVEIMFVYRAKGFTDKDGTFYARGVPAKVDPKTAARLLEASNGAGARYFQRV